MAKYDDASWHYGGNYPEDISNENAATHIGIFLTWCIDNDLISEFQIEEAGDDVEKVRNKTLIGADFLMMYCDEKLTDEDLNDLGNEFANDYYNDETEFAKQYGSYLNDYSIFFNEKAKAENKIYPSLYHIKNSWNNYNLIKPIIDKRFLEWKTFIATK